MSIISLYDAIPRRPLASLEPVKPAPEEKKDIYHPIADNSRVVTLAEFDPVSKDAITAHRLKDYRSKTFKLTLLPEIRILLDDILEGSTYWNAKLHNESPYE